MEKKQGKKRQFTESDKLSIIDEHLCGSSIYGLCKKYSLHSAQIYEWLYKYGIQKKQTDIVLMKKKEEEPEMIALLQKELRQLRKELAEEKLRSTAYDKMIGTAEEMFHIDIRKKVGTKQSKR